MDHNNHVLDYGKEAQVPTEPAEHPTKDAKEIRPVCKKIMQNRMEVYVDDDETKLRFRDLKQHFVQLKENQKIKMIFELLNDLTFDQAIIFVNSVPRCLALVELLTEQNFAAIYINGGMQREERVFHYQHLKGFQKRIIVATNLFGRGLDFERGNTVFNFDMPEDSATYLDRVARAGRFSTYGSAVSFATNDDDFEIMKEMHERFGAIVHSRTRKV